VVIAASRRGGDPTVRASSQWESLAIDVTSTPSVRSAVELIDRKHGRIDVLVNAAGTTATVPAAELHRLSDDVVDDVMASNVAGAIRLVRESLPLLRRAQNPAVISISSVAARTGLGSNTAYGGAKAALDAMIVSWAKALAPVRFVNVAPSALANDFVPGRPAEFLARTVSATPLQRLATADEVAAAVLVAARALPMTTGVTIAVDGGRHL
jgi:3-oxoacyl-[acyl-carrier protein] reductase